jgi:hypothetical protein
MNERTQIAAKLIISHIVLIVGLLLISTYTTKDAFILLTIAQTVLCLLFFAGYWEFFGLRFKNIFCGFTEFTLLLIAGWKLSSGFSTAINIYLIVVLSIVQIWLLAELIKIVWVILKKDHSAVGIEFPFHHGNYLITDGGNSRISRLMNYHYYSPVHQRKKTNNSMLYATDIVKIAKDKWKSLPKRNEEYPIFNEQIFSPMDGVVVTVVDNIPDNQPFSGDYPYNTGNTVVIRKDNQYLLLGHLKQGSIVVKEGDVIHANNLIGAAGNSGWTERPHLHMQLIQSDSNKYWSGTGLCIRYENKNLYKNSLIKR